MTDEQMAALFLAYGSLIMVVAVVAFVLWLLLVIAHWRMFTKAGEKGWKTLIPVYADYTLFKLVWNTKSFWIYVVAILLTGLATAFSGSYTVVNGQLVAVGSGNFFVGLVSNIASIVVLVYAALLAIKTSLAYGKGMVFSLGMIFFPSIFAMILGFGPARYIGPQD